jgi:hypothetical protein
MAGLGFSVPRPRKGLKHTPPMKRLISFLFALGFGASAFAQQNQLNPFNGSQQRYVDNNFHMVPYFLSFPNNGITTLIFDPSTSTTDLTNAFKHASKAIAASADNSSVLNYVVLPNVVDTNIQVQETRVQVPFSVTASTTLQTIPFSVPVAVETNGHYRIEARLYVTTGTGGSKIDIGGTCNTSNFVAEYQCFAATTLLYGGQLTSFLSGPSGSSTGTATEIVLTGELDVTNGGTLVIQFAQNASNATASTVLAGSTFTVTQIP